LKFVYERTYSPATADSTLIARAIVAARFGRHGARGERARLQTESDPRAMVGLQSTAIRAQLGSLLNGFINYEFWLPVPKMQFPGVAELISCYQATAAAEGVNPLGYYMAPWGYAQLQVLQQAVEATKTLDDAKLADYLREHVFTTVVGDVKFGAKGEWAQSRVLQVQYQNIRGSDITQFKDMSTQVVVAPAEYASGEII
jgi:branched-chain amino acid transport system substrate-binding protein